MSLHSTRARADALGSAREPATRLPKIMVLNLFIKPPFQFCDDLVPRLFSKSPFCSSFPPIRSVCVGSIFASGRRLVIDYFAKTRLTVLYWRNGRANQRPVSSDLLRNSIFWA